MANRKKHYISITYLSWLYGLLVAGVVCVSPLHAHIGISEEIEALNVLVRDDPQAPEHYLQRGELHRSSKHWSEALADFRKVLQIDRANAAAELGIGRTWLDQGRYRLALKHLDRAVTLQPGNVRALVSRARARHLSGNSLDAAADYQRAIDTFKAPKDPLPEYYFERARALEAAGAGYIDTAIESLDAGIGRLGNLRILEDYAIELERKRSNYESARNRLDRIIKRSARKESLLLKRGEIMLEAGQPAAAKADFVAARAAIDALPPQRRHSRLMTQMRSNIESRLRVLKNSGGGE